MTGLVTNFHNHFSAKRSFDKIIDPLLSLILLDTLNKNSVLGRLVEDKKSRCSKFIFKATQSPRNKMLEFVLAVS